MRGLAVERSWGKGRWEGRAEGIALRGLVVERS